MEDNLASNKLMKKLLLLFSIFSLTSNVAWSADYA